MKILKAIATIAINFALFHDQAIARILVRVVRVIRAR